MSQCLFDDQCQTYRSTHGVGLATHYGICIPCERHGREAIRQLFPDWVLLDAMIPKVTYGVPADTTRVTAVQVEAPIPLRSEVDYLARWIAWSLADWEYVVRERGRLANVGVAVRPVISVPRASQLLTEHYPILLNTPTTQIVDYVTNQLTYADGIEAIALFIGLHHRARGMIGLSRIREHRAVPCPEPPAGCGLFELASYLDGKYQVGDDVFCVNCGWRCTAEQYSQYLKTFIPPEDHYAEAA